MTTIAFDTLKYANTLKQAGFTQEQAEAHVAAQSAVLSEVLEANRQDLATKGDIEKLRLEIEKVKAELEKLRLEVKTDIEKSKVELIKWNVGAIIAAAGLAMAIARLFFQQ